MMNSKNLGVKIMENGALDRNIWGLEALKGKIVFHEVLGVFVEFWMTEKLWRKRTKAFAEFANSMGIFGVFGAV
jgi:hypothetical protein